ncbi:MAG: hypothetical protein V3R87_02940 [Dehalococcoidia bacterium]
MNDERGQALALALVALAVGALLVSPFLRGVSGHSIASRHYSTSTLQQYSAEAGVEDAIWDITYGNLTSQLGSPGDSVTYSLGQSVNGVSPAITVTRADAISDDFESGNLTGGSGWLTDWELQGDSSIINTESPYEGSYHLQLTGSTGNATRSADLSGQSGMRLQFWAKADSFENTEAAYCQVSSNGTDWTTVQTWARADADGIYRFYDIDLSPYTMTSQFWIAFDADMGKAQDQFYVDYLQIAASGIGIGYEIVSTAGGERVRADILIVGGNVTIDSWIVQKQSATPTPTPAPTPTPTPAPTPTPTPTLAGDDFESGGWSGGSGWLADWTNQGDSSIIGTDSPYEGSYHMHLWGSTGYVTRSVDLSGESGVRLQFWAKANSFENTEAAYCQVSSDGTGWTTVQTWAVGDDDGIYRFYDIDLSPYTMSAQFWIAFDADMGNAIDYFYVDNVVLVN